MFTCGPYLGLLGFGDTIGLHTRRSHAVRQHTIKGPQSLSIVHSSGAGVKGQWSIRMKSTGQAAEIQEKYNNTNNDSLRNAILTVIIRQICIRFVCCCFYSKLRCF